MIAETLGMTVEYLRKNMTLEEVYGWNAYFTIKAEREEEAYEKAKRQAQVRKVR
jgi:hypothetical protein